MEQRLDLHARSATRKALILVACFGASAQAAPKTDAGKLHFEAGVKAYQAKDYKLASSELEQSYNAENDVETLFAWAQSERLQGNCDSARGLFEKLLATGLPAENAKAVRVAQEDCTPAARPEPAPVKPPEPVKQPEPPPVKPVDEPRAWWKDPVGGALAIGGVVGIGVGVTFLVSARSADKAATDAKTYGEFVSNSDKAKSKQLIGFVSGGVGLALVGASVYWYSTHREKSSGMTAWIDPTSASGGIALAF